MLPENLCRRDIPGLDEAIFARDYALLDGKTENEVLSLITSRKLLGTQFEGEWYVEAPPDCELQLTRLHEERTTAHSPDSLGGDTESQNAFACPHCGATLEATEDLGNRTLCLCLECNKTFPTPEHLKGPMLGGYSISFSKTSIWKILFSFSGRLPRFTYSRIILVFALFGVLRGVYFLNPALLGLTFDRNIADQSALFIGLPLLWVVWAAGAKRLHDLNKSAWLSLFFIVPFINIALLLYLLLKRGTVGPNLFGEDTLNHDG